MEKDVYLMKYVLRFGIAFIVLIFSIEFILEIFGIRLFGIFNLVPVLVTTYFSSYFSASKFVEVNKRVPTSTENKKLVYLLVLAALMAFVLPLVILLIVNSQLRIIMYQWYRDVGTLIIILFISIYCLIMYGLLLVTYGYTARVSMQKLSDKNEI